MLEPLRDAWAVLLKDLRIELRSREILYSMGFFALLIVVVFAFAFLGEADGGADSVAAGQAVGPGILWVAFVFAGTLGLNRSAAREQDNEVLAGILVSPASRVGVFLGKATANLVFMLVMAALLLPLIALLFDLSLLPQLGWHLAVVLLGSLGFCSLGTLFSVMLLNTRLRDVMLPLVFYPVVTPVVIGGVKASGALLTGDLVLAMTWMKLLLAFAAVFGTASAWVFGWILGE